MSNTVLRRMNALYLLNTISMLKFKDMIVEEVCDLSRGLAL